MYSRPGTLKIIAAGILSFGLLAGASSAFADDCQVFDAVAKGSSTQLGKQFNVKLRFCKESSDEDRKRLVDAYKKGGTPELTRTLQKMPSVGRISLPSTVGWDIAYIRTVNTPTGREIRFVTDRKVAFGELYQSTRSLDYSLTAGKLHIDKNPDKSSGIMYPAAMIRTNKKKNEIQVELYQNPWKLENVIDWNKKGNKE